MPDGKPARLGERQMLAAGPVEGEEALRIEPALRQPHCLLELGPQRLVRGLELERGHGAAEPACGVRDRHAASARRLRAGW